MIRNVVRQAVSLLDGLRPSYDGPATWLWFVGIARIGMLLVVAMGTQLVAEEQEAFRYLLTVIYGAAFASSLWYLIVLRRDRSVPAILTWTQVLVDFGVVAVTISYTGGQESFFTFLLVIVILEAGVLMGLIQGFVFATMASIYMLYQVFVTPGTAQDPLALWYQLLIQILAFFFTAFISGYWNQRVSRMKQFQREILDNMNSGFLITDAKGLVVAMNKAACGILKLVEENMAGRHVDGIIVPESGVECPVTTALRLKKDFTSYEFYAQIGEDSPKLLGLTTNRIRDAHGHLTGLIASFTDLTEMARMRKELQQQDRMAVIGELSAGLAHEIRNPVASIRGSMDELQRNMDSPDLVQRLAAIAVRESDHLNEIVTGFLDFARDPSRRYALFDVCEVAREVEEQLLRKFGGDSGLAITFLAPVGPCLIMGDKTQIWQVFTNLGQNAVEAMDGRGALEVVVDNNEGRGPIEICFNDNGPGIAPDKVSRIFEPFYTEKDRGVGMGLAICMRMITAHDGTIQAASRSGGGTSMSVRLPQARNTTKETDDRMRSV
ncbi:MAG: ATP-binding protein [Candidatus Hydrogenedentes bacterium]|nr:ATP-binding protein [Candidatus Hydrogenedentota bacterium]